MIADVVPLRLRLAAEALGTALLVAIVVGSGIMGERMAGGNAAIALLANSAATGCGLFVLILVFAPVSGAHFNPLVSLVFALLGALPARIAAAYAVVQLTGALAGVAWAHAMFELAPWVVSAHARTGLAQWLAEASATFGLVLTILGCARYGIAVLAAAVGAYIAAAYWFTASTSFANPVVTIARALTPTFSGIRPGDVAAFVAAQAAGALIALLFWRAIGSARESS
jgi:glycerol uptake facilitator-like aquaporin